MVDVLDVFYYKGFTAELKYSEEDKVYYGKVANISDLVSFEGTTKMRAEMDFHRAVKDYLRFKKTHDNKKGINNDK